MEVNMVELKTSFERKIIKTVDSITLKHLNELKSVEERNTYKIREIEEKIKSTNFEFQKFKIQDVTPANKNLNNLNEVLENESRKRQTDHEENQKLFYQVQQNIHSLEKEFLERLKEHRDYQLEMFKSGEEERNMYNKIQGEKEDGEVEYLKNYIRTVERKLEDESAFRLKNEDDLRNWFEQKVASIHQKLKNEEKMSLDREKKIMEQLQESLVTINEIINGTKEQNLISISRSQTLLNDNMSNLTETIEAVKDSLTSRMDEVEREIAENRNKLNDVQVSTYKHAQTVNDTLDKEINRFEKVIGAFEKLIYNQTNEIRETMTTNDEKINKWRVNFEDLQTKKLLEIHTVLKQLNKNLSKAKEDTKERINVTSKELTEVKSKVESDDKDLEYRVSIIVSRCLEKHDIENIDFMNKHADIVKSTKNELAYIIDKNNDEMKDYIEKIKKDSERDKNKARDEMLLEGRCQAFSMEIEKRMKEELELFKQETERKHGFTKTKFDQTNRDILTANTRLDQYKIEVNKQFKVEENNAQKWKINEIEKHLDSHKILLVRDFNDKLENETRQRNERIKEISVLMESNKNLANEHIRNQIDSLRSLMKALVNKESSERNKEYENIMKILSTRIESVETSSNNLIKEETEKMNVKMDTFKTEFEALKESHTKHLNIHDAAIEENSQNISDHYQEHSERISNLERDNA